MFVAFERVADLVVGARNEQWTVQFFSVWVCFIIFFFYFIRFFGKLLDFFFFLVRICWCCWILTLIWTNGDPDMDKQGLCLDVEWSWLAIYKKKFLKVHVKILSESHAIYGVYVQKSQPSLRTSYNEVTWTNQTLLTDSSRVKFLTRSTDQTHQIQWKLTRDKWLFRV